MTTTRRHLIADAAIATLAREGMRGLTHRAVDQSAGLPAGSSSYYFRTRQTLLQAALERLIEVDTADVPPQPAGPTGVADAAAALVRHWSTTAAERTVARYELMLEAARRPELQNVLTRARDHYHRLAEQTLTAAGATDPPAQAQVFIACLDGLVFRHLTGADRLPPTQSALQQTLMDVLHGFTRLRP